MQAKWLSILPFIIHIQKSFITSNTLRNKGVHEIAPKTHTLGAIGCNNNLDEHIYMHPGCTLHHQIGQVKIIYKGAD